MYVWHYGSRFLLKVHPLHHGVSFHPSLPFFFFLHPLKQHEKLTKEDVNKLLHLLLITSHKDNCLCMCIISDVSPVNTF